MGGYKKIIKYCLSGSPQTKLNTLIKKKKVEEYQVLFPLSFRTAIN